jgi:hypothetical protein
MTEKVEESEEADVEGQECGGGRNMRSARAVGCLHRMWYFGDREVDAERMDGARCMTYVE